MERTVAIGNQDFKNIRNGSICDILYDVYNRYVIHLKICLLIGLMILPLRLLECFVDAVNRYMNSFAAEKSMSDNGQAQELYMLRIWEQIQRRMKFYSQSMKKKEERKKLSALMN